MHSVASFDKCSSHLGDLNATHFMNIFPLCPTRICLETDTVKCHSHGNQFRIKNNFVFFVFHILVFHILVFHVLVFHVLVFHVLVFHVLLFHVLVFHVLVFNVLVFHILVFHVLMVLHI